jgi:hypothetical protein
MPCHQCFIFVFTLILFVLEEQKSGAFKPSSAVQDIREREAGKYV